MVYTKSIRLPQHIKNALKDIPNKSKYISDLMRIYADNPDATLTMLVRRANKRIHDPIFAKLNGPVSSTTFTIDPDLLRRFAETTALFERSIDLLILSILEDEFFVKGNQ